MNTEKPSLWIIVDNNYTSPSIPEKQETTRSSLAKGFSILYGIVLCSYIIYGIFLEPTQEKNSILSIILSATTWFVWTILGFYFGQNSK